MEEIIKCLVSKVMDNLDSANTHELGEAVDMIKDLKEAMYYDAMIKKYSTGSHEEQPK